MQFGMSTELLDSSVVIWAYVVLRIIVRRVVKWVNVGQADIDSFMDSLPGKASQVLHQMDWPLGIRSKGQSYPKQNQLQRKKDLSATKKPFQEQLIFFHEKRLIDVCLCPYLSTAV